MGGWGVVGWVVGEGRAEGMQSRRRQGRAGLWADPDQGGVLPGSGT